MTEQLIPTNDWTGLIIRPHEKPSTWLRWIDIDCLFLGSDLAALANSISTYPTTITTTLLLSVCTIIDAPTQPATTYQQGTQSIPKVHDFGARLLSTQQPRLNEQIVTRRWYGGDTNTPSVEISQLHVAIQISFIKLIKVTYFRMKGTAIEYQTIWMSLREI